MSSTPGTHGAQCEPVSRKTLNHQGHEGSRRLWGPRHFLGVLLLLLLWGRHILREAFQGDLTRAGGRFLGFVGCVLDENSLSDIIGFVAATLALAPVDRPPKLERCAMDGVGGKCELVGIELARFKKMIQKNA